MSRYLKHTTALGEALSNGRSHLEGGSLGKKRRHKSGPRSPKAAAFSERAA